MGFLTEAPDYIIKLEGKRFEVNPAFDVVLEIQNLYREEELSDLDKLEQALKMLVVSGHPEELSMQAKAELLEEIYQRYVNMRKRPKAAKEKNTLDFDYDGEYIYASFMMDYGIDLIDLQGRLPWKKFIALFQGLSKNTKIREVMRIRAMDIPSYNGKNGKEVREIQELKSYYALPVRGGGGQSGLNLLFHALESMATKK